MMPVNQYSSQRASRLWKNLIGMFGAEALSRKFGDTAPPEWLSLVGSLKDFEIERGIRRLGYSGKGYVPTLPEFAKLCRTVGDENDPKPAPKLLDDGYTGDIWDIERNRHMLAHVLRRGAKKIYYGPIRTKILLDAAKIWAQDMREWDGPPTAVEQRKNWATIMERADVACASITLDPITHIPWSTPSHG